MAQRPPNGNKHTNTNGPKKPTPPGWIPSIRSAPATSPNRMRVMARDTYRAIEQQQRASDDSRTAQLQQRSVRSLFAVTENEDDDVITIPRRPQLSGLASINGVRFNKLPVYTVQEILAEYIILRSIGLPHREVIVLGENATFNGISMRDFRIKDVLKSGDHVLVERVSCWYGGSGAGGRDLVWRALGIGFPRYSKGELPKGARWITHGRVDGDRKTDNGDVMIDTEVEPTSAVSDDATVAVRAQLHAFPFNEVVADSTVFVRAELKRGGKEAWSKVSTGLDTPWDAEGVSIVGGIRSGRGFLKRGYARLITTVCAGGGFGYVYVPQNLITAELKSAPDNSWVEFEACINRVRGNKDEKYLKSYKWRAVWIKVINKQQQQKTRDLSKSLLISEQLAEAPTANNAIAAAQNSPCDKCGGQLVCMCV